MSGARDPYGVSPRYGTAEPLELTIGEGPRRGMMPSLRESAARIVALLVDSRRASGPRSASAVKMARRRATNPNCQSSCCASHRKHEKVGSASSAAFSLGVSGRLSSCSSEVYSLDARCPAPRVSSDERV